MQNEGLKWFGILPRPKPLSLSLAVTPFSLMSEVCGPRSQSVVPVFSSGVEQIGLDELVNVAIHHPVHLMEHLICTMIFNHLVRVHYI